MVQLSNPPIPRGTVRRICNITEKEMDALIYLCVRAYQDEPSIPAMVGGRDELRSLLFRAMIGAGVLGGELYIVENLKKEIISMALWFAPGSSMWTSEEQRNAGYNQLMNELDDYTKDWWKNSYGSEVGKFAKKVLPKAPIDCWWLSVLATDPEHQRQGYATWLINEVLNNITSSSVSGLCATRKENEQYYHNLGFQTEGYMELASRYGNIPVFFLATKAKTKAK